MPYIGKPNRRQIVEKHYKPDYESNIRYTKIKTAGELQYAIAVMINDFVKRQGLKYQVCNDVMGALAGAQMEFYRRTVAPYEDKKIEENGDV